MGKDPARTTDLVNKKRVESEFLRNKLKLKSLEAKQSLFGAYPHVEKYLAEKGLDLSKLREHSAKVITTGALTGTLLFAPPMMVKDLPSPKEIVKSIADWETASPEAPQKLLLDSLKEVLPAGTRPLDRSQEKTLEQIFDRVVGVKTKAALEGEHLNTTYGYIGAEQHLMRYPGDTMKTHPKVAQDDEGMAPGRGAWGYFAPSKTQLSDNLVETEKWYAVVQTLYLPDWSRRQPYLRDWYKYRKVLIVNTTNGNAVVAAVADSGPAAFTGKSFGGSPEVMNYLGGPRYKKGPVVVFFVDDPENRVKLGPVDYNNVNIPGVALTQV